MSFIPKLLLSSKHRFLTGFIAVLSAVLLFFNLKFWQSQPLGILFFIIYLVINSYWLARILKKPLAFGFFLSLYLIGFATAVPIVIYKITPLIFVITLLVLTLIISFLNHRIKESPRPTVEKKQGAENNSFRFNRVCYLLVAICYLLCFWLLFKARTGEFMLTPWKVISPLYLYLYLMIIFTVGLFVFSRLKARTILIIIILVSLLCHAYLIVVYQTGCGGDKWRHIGAERWLDQGNIYSPSLFGEGKIDWQVFVIGNKTSYANMWGLSLALHWATRIDFFWIDLLLGWLLWSIFIPLFSYYLAGYISKVKSFRLLMAFLPILFFPLQFYGALTLPLSFTFLFLLFVLLLWMDYLKNQEGNVWLNWSLVIFTILMYFSYALYFVLAIELAIVAWLLKRMLSRTLLVSILLFTLCCILILPILDTGYGLSGFKANLNFPLVINSLGAFFKNLVIGQAIFSRTHFVEQDNLIYMESSVTQTKTTLLNTLPWAYILTPIVLFFVIWGLVRIKKMVLKTTGIILAIFLFITLFNQFIGSFLMEGNHIFTKRLVVFTSFLLVPFFAWGLWSFIKIKMALVTARVKIILVCLILALIGTTTYASGPKMQVVTADERAAAQYVWNEIKLSAPRGPTVREAGVEMKEGELTPGDIKGRGYCVLANTWPLLALEAESGRQIMAGGFPIYLEYGQSERVQLFERMNQGPSIKYLEKAVEITGASSCYFMTEKKWLGRDLLAMGDEEEDEILELLKNTLGQPKIIGGVYIWKYESE